MDHPQSPAYTYRAQVERVIDGDTFIARIDLGFRVGVSLRVRIHDLYAAELHDTSGSAAKAALTSALAGPLLVRSYKDRQSFERWICDVFVAVADGGWVSVADILGGHPEGQGVKA